MIALFSSDSKFLKKWLWLAVQLCNTYVSVAARLWTEAFEHRSLESNQRRRR